jgi:hypothetical protein
MTRIIGIDPGIQGAIALIDTDQWTLAVIDMPLEAGVKGKSKVSAGGLLQAIRVAQPDHAFLENVTASPQQGVTSAFSFGDGFGCARTALLASGCQLTLPRPQDWKRETKTPTEKRQATTRAAQLFPSAHSAFYGPRGGAYDGRAEASLLAFYGLLMLRLSPTQTIRVTEYPIEALNA